MTDLKQRLKGRRFAAGEPITARDLAVIYREGGVACQARVKLAAFLGDERCRGVIGPCDCHGFATSRCSLGKPLIRFCPRRQGDLGAWLLALRRLSGWAEPRVLLVASIAAARSAWPYMTCGCTRRRQLTSDHCPHKSATMAAITAADHHVLEETDESLEAWRRSWTTALPIWVPRPGLPFVGRSNEIQVSDRAAPKEAARRAIQRSLIAWALEGIGG